MDHRAPSHTDSTMLGGCRPNDELVVGLRTLNSVEQPLPALRICPTPAAPVHIRRNGQSVVAVQGRRSA